MENTEKDTEKKTRKGNNVNTRTLNQSSSDVFDTIVLVDAHALPLYGKPLEPGMW